MRIVAWVKRRLRDWLLEGQEPGMAAPDPYINCLVPGPGGPALTRVLITGIVGLRLAATMPDGRGQRLVGREECPDGDHWSRLWQWHSRDRGMELVWEDGAPFQP